MQTTPLPLGKHGLDITGQEYFLPTQPRYARAVGVCNRIAQTFRTFHTTRPSDLGSYILNIDT